MTTVLEPDLHTQAQENRAARFRKRGAAVAAGTVAVAAAVTFGCDPNYTNPGLSASEDGTNLKQAVGMGPTLSVSGQRAKSVQHPPHAIVGSIAWQMQRDYGQR